jgi:hypothetical protein
MTILNLLHFDHRNAQNKKIDALEDKGKDLEEKQEQLREDGAELKSDRAQIEVDRREDEAFDAKAISEKEALAPKWALRNLPE